MSVLILIIKMNNKKCRNLRRKFLERTKTYVETKLKIDLWIIVKKNWGYNGFHHCQINQFDNGLYQTEPVPNKLERHRNDDEYSVFPIQVRKLKRKFKSLRIGNYFTKTIQDPNASFLTQRRNFAPRNSAQRTISTTTLPISTRLSTNQSSSLAVLSLP